MRPFTDRRSPWLETFADQAVIAINNVGLFEEVQARTKELTESLEYQTATCRSALRHLALAERLQPVSMPSSNGGLCGAEFSNIALVADGQMHLTALNNMNEDVLAEFRARYPMAPDRTQIGGRAILTGEIVRVVDILKDPTIRPRWRALAVGAR